MTDIILTMGPHTKPLRNNCYVCNESFKLPSERDDVDLCERCMDVSTHMTKAERIALHNTVLQDKQNEVLYKQLKKLWLTHGILYKFLHDKYEVKTVSSAVWGEQAAIFNP